MRDVASGAISGRAVPRLESLGGAGSRSNRRDHDGDDGKRLRGGEVLPEKDESGEGAERRLEAHQGAEDSRREIAQAEHLERVGKRTREHGYPDAKRKNREI